jgi:hypothetical protein
MAKSSRSKSQRRNRALLREAIYNPAADARQVRLAEASAIAMTDDGTSLSSTQSRPVAGSLMVDIPSKSSDNRRHRKLGRVSRVHGRRLRSPLNEHGLSARELSF